MYSVLAEVMKRKSGKAGARTRIRDLNRTREKIIAAALTEFSAKGAAGARTESIARRAKVDQRMIFYCFGSKAGLYREVLRRHLADKLSIIEADPYDDFSTSLCIAFDSARTNVDHVRMWQWEALEWGRRKLVAEEDRRAFLQRQLLGVRRAQERGELPAGLEPEMLVLVRIALAAFPFAIPQISRLATGFEPDDPEFILRWTRCLRAVGDAISASPHIALADGGGEAAPAKRTLVV